MKYKNNIGIFIKKTNNKMDDYSKFIKFIVNIIINNKETIYSISNNSLNHYIETDKSLYHCYISNKYNLCGSSEMFDKIFVDINVKINDVINELVKHINTGIYQENDYIYDCIELIYEY